jgi:hypothetical protein
LGGITTTTAATNYTLSAADNGNTIAFTAGAAITVTVPPGLSVNFRCKLLQLAAGKATPVSGGGGVMINATSGLTGTSGPFTEVLLEAFAANQYVMTAPGTPSASPIIPLAISYQPAIDPGNTPFANFTGARTIVGIRGTPEIAVGAAATLTVVKAPSGTALSAGTPLHTGSFDANGAPSIDQTLALAVTTLAAGDRIGILSSGGANWANGSGQGVITVLVI